MYMMSPPASCSSDNHDIIKPIVNCVFANALTILCLDNLSQDILTGKQCYTPGNGHCLVVQPVTCSNDFFTSTW